MLVTLLFLFLSIAIGPVEAGKRHAPKGKDSKDSSSDYSERSPFHQSLPDCMPDAKQIKKETIAKALLCPMIK